MPFVSFAGPSAGLGQAQPPPSTYVIPSQYNWWQQILIPLGQSVGGAVSSRIAYGRQPAPYTTPYGYGSGSPGTGLPYAGGGIGGFDPKILLLFGGAFALLMMLRR